MTALEGGANEIVGRRLELAYCSDPYTQLQPGAKGTVGFVDDLGTLFVDWDSGASLGLVPGEDSWKLLPEGGEA